MTSERLSDTIWDYIALDTKLYPTNFFGRVSLYSTLFIQPIWNILYWITWLLVPSLFQYLGGNYDADIFRTAMTILNTVHVAYSSISKWSDVVRHYNLGTVIYGMKLRTLKMPKIQIRSADPRHQYFKYLTVSEPPPHPKTSY
jgi:hypothetical protein